MGWTSTGSWSEEGWGQAASAGGVFTTLDPASAGPTISITNGNLRITGGASAGAALSIASRSSGKYWWELTVVSIAGPSTLAVGLSSAAGANTGANSWPGGAGHIGVFASGIVWAPSYSVGTTNSFANVGERVMIEWDADANQMWVRGATGRNGPHGTFLTNPLFAYVYIESGCVADLNFGQATPLYTPTAGFTGLV